MVENQEGDLKETLLPRYDIEDMDTQHNYQTFDTAKLNIAIQLANQKLNEQIKPKSLENSVILDTS